MPNNQSEYAHGEAWPWYAQLPSIAVLSGFASCALPGGFGSQSLWLVATTSTAFAFLAFAFGYLAGSRWTPLWIFLGWILPVAGMHALFNGLDLAAWSRASGAVDAVSFVVGAFATLAGTLLRTRSHRAYLLAIPCVALATLALWLLSESLR